MKEYLIKVYTNSKTDPTLELIRECDLWSVIEMHYQKGVKITIHEVIQLADLS